MDGNSLSFRESVFLLLMFLLTAGFLACSMALHALAASLPYVLLVLIVSACLIAFTATKCYVMVIESKSRRYLDNRHYNYIEAGCREVERSGRIRDLIGRRRE